MVKHKIHFFFSPAVLAAVTVAVLLYSGLIKPANRNAFNSLLLPQDVVQVDGILASNPVKTSSGRFYSVLIQTQKVLSPTLTSSAHGQVQLLVPAAMVEALYPGKLYTSASKNLFESTKIPLIEQGAHIMAYLRFLPPNTDEENKIFQKNSYPLFIVESIEHIGWQSLLAQTRAVFRLEFKRMLYAWENAGGLLLALLSGSREYTDPTLAEGFKNAGLSHILALSGMHLSLFAGIALSAGRFMGGKKIGTVLSLCAVIIFVWFAGISPSLFRAFLSSIIAVVLATCFVPSSSGQFYGLFSFITPASSSIRLIRILSLAFLIQVCIFPLDVFSPAFMLSYGALVGISIAECTIKPLIGRVLPESLASSLSASIGAQICTAPVTAMLFGTIMPIGIIASVVMSPFALGFLVFGFAGIVICAIMPFLLYPFGYIIQYVYSLLEQMVLWFAQFPSIQF